MRASSLSAVRGELPRPRVGFGLAFEERARHVIEQHLVLGRELLASTPRQMPFERGLVHQQFVERAVYS